MNSCIRDNNKLTGMIIDSCLIDAAIAKLDERDPVVLAALFDLNNTYVSNGGVDMSDCGYSDDPCKTISTAIGRVDGEKTIRLMVGGHSITGALSIDTKTIKIEKDLKAESDVSVDIPSEFSGDNVFSISTGSLSLSGFAITISKDFSSTDESKGYLFYCSGSGSITISSMTFNGQSKTFSQTFALVYNAQSVICSNSSFKEMTVSKHALFWSYNYENGYGWKYVSSMTFTDTNFTSITAQGDTGCIFSTGTGETQTSIKRCQFTTCNSPTKGGAIFTQVNGSSGVRSIESCSFDSCQTTSTDNNNQYGGGALYIQIDQDTSKFSLLSSSFKDCTAPYGGAIYVKLSKKPEYLLFDGLTFSGNTGSQTTIGNGGNTLYVNGYSNIGQEFFPDFLTGDDNYDNQGTTTQTTTDQYGRTSTSLVTIASLFAPDDQFSFDVNNASQQGIDNYYCRYTNYRPCKSLRAGYGAYSSLVNAFVSQYPQVSREDMLDQITITLNLTGPTAETQTLAYVPDSDTSYVNTGNYRTLITSTASTNTVTLSDYQNTDDTNYQHGFFFISTGTLTMSTFTLSISTQMSYPIIDIETGSVTMTSIIIKSTSQYSHN